MHLDHVALVELSSPVSNTEHLGISLQSDSRLPHIEHHGKSTFSNIVCRCCYGHPRVSDNDTICNHRSYPILLTQIDHLVVNIGGSNEDSDTILSYVVVTMFIQY